MQTISVQPPTPFAEPGTTSSPEDQQILAGVIPLDPQSFALPWPTPEKNNPAGLSLQQSHWTPRCHRLVDPVSRDVDGRFLREWRFVNAKSKEVFLKAGFSRVTCLYFPLARDDRIAFACRLLTVLFLIDDYLEEMSLADGEAYNDRLIKVSKGLIPPNPEDPADVILHELWADMAEKDAVLAEAVKEPTFTFMRAQTDRVRLSMKGLGNYLVYREGDVGKALLSALMVYTMELHLSDAEVAGLKVLEQNCSRHISVVNDIFSWEKEYKASLELHREGATLCSAVNVLMDETVLNVQATQRVLWSMVREWEKVHDSLVEEKTKAKLPSSAVLNYMKGLEFQMSGNELWSMTTQRYSEVD